MRERSLPEQAGTSVIPARGAWPGRGLVWPKPGIASMKPGGQNLQPGRAERDREQAFN